MAYRSHMAACLIDKGQKLKQYYLQIAFTNNLINSNYIHVIHFKSANGELSISKACSES